MSEHHDEKLPIAIPLEQLKQLAAAVAEELKAAATPVPADVRERFINVRAALFQRGIYDPVLVRFDSATAPRATAQEIAEQLSTVAGAL
jgi:hypothetical protein